MTLKIGDKAPLFTCKDQNGSDVQLTDFLGRKVILYFYPKDDTAGCTAQACNLRDHHEILWEKGYTIVGISSDGEKAHQKFIAKYQLPFVLLADTDKAVHELYGTWQEKKMYGRTYMGTARTTFLIDESGVIINIVTKVDTKNHVEQLLTNPTK